jgi:predicted lipoprotein with Yx(FWY)xxD motif
MRPTLKILVPAVLASLILAACGSSSKGSGSSSSATAAASSSPAATTSAASGEGASSVVKTASNATVGATVLTDAQGMTLYRLSGEHAGKFICTSAACLQVWHPVSASAGSSAPTGSVGSLGVVKRPDGTEQVTYKGMPLYTFVQDQQPGEAKGQGLKDVGTWNAVTTSASSSSGTPAATSTEGAPSTPATQTSPPAEPATPAKSGGSYGY